MDGRPVRSAPLTGLLLILALVPVSVPRSAVSASPATPTATSDSDWAQEREFHLRGPGSGSRSGPLELAHGFLDLASVQVWVDGRLWERDVDYQVQGRSGRIVPLRGWLEERPAGDGAPPEPALVIVSYRYRPLALPSRVDLRPVAPPPSGPGAQATDATKSAGGGAGAGQDLEVRGSKSVQVSSGSRREMTVDQNLRLDISGQLTPEIAVRAFMTDDNLPVVPEGNTEELRDIDKVLVQMRGPNWQATLGDFVARRQDTVFGRYRRKLQGFSLDSQVGSSRVEVLAGAPRGRYRSVQIRGEESNQGPYYLGAESGAANLFIVAGSERVTLDGATMTRGADRDYVIDYLTGSVTFTYRRLITAESTIVVEFEQGEGAYSRTVLGGGAGYGAELTRWSIPIDFSARVVREKDDPARLRTGELSEQDEAVLAAAGDDDRLAVARGVTAAAAGEGLYARTIAGSDTVYVFQEGGDYDVDFYLVGAGLGDYELDRLDELGRRIFVHRGEGLGSYRIGRPLTRPESHSLATLALAIGDSTGSGLTGEWSVSSVDGNLLSERDDGDNDGGAGRVAGRLAPTALAAGDRGLGSIESTAFLEVRQGRFHPFELRRSRFDYERWGLGERAARSGFLEEFDREMGWSARWTAGAKERRLALTMEAGGLDHGASLQADQQALQGEWSIFGARGRHREQRASASDDLDPLRIERENRAHELAWTLGPVTPSARYGRSQWRDGARTGLAGAGYRLTEFGYGLTSSPGGALSWRADFGRALADSLRDGAWGRERDSRTLQGNVTTGRWWGMRWVGEGTWRRTLRPDGREESTRLGRLDLSGAWPRAQSDWSLGYRVDNSRARVLDRQIVYVGQRQGDYDQDGNYLGIDQGDYDVILAATDSLVATTAVQTDLRWRQGFGFLGKERWTGAWTAVTQATVSGRSTTDEVGDLLTLRRSALFDRERTVLSEIRFAEELILLQHLKRFDLRGRFDFHEALDRQYSDHPEDRIGRTWLVNSNYNATQRFSLRGRAQYDRDRRASEENLASVRRSYDVTTWTGELGGVYRVASASRVSLQGEYIQRQDGVSTVQQDEYALRPETRLRLGRQWSVQGLLRVAEVVAGGDGSGTRPWFFPEPGRNVESSLRLTWEPTRYLTVAGSWFTRKEGEGRWEHDLRLESTARF